MKTTQLLFISIITLIFSINTYAFNVESYELTSLKAEFFDTSNHGLITPIDCANCKQKTYKFDTTVEIYKENKLISITDFMADYWNARHPTIFIDTSTNLVYKIRY